MIAGCLKVDEALQEGSYSHAAVFGSKPRTAAAPNS
jgi:hypothetical protein